MEECHRGSRHRLRIATIQRKITNALVAENGKRVLPLPPPLMANESSVPAPLPLPSPFRRHLSHRCRWKENRHKKHLHLPTLAPSTWLKHLRVVICVENVKSVHQMLSVVSRKVLLLHRAQEAARKRPAPARDSSQALTPKRLRLGSKRVVDRGTDKQRDAFRHFFD